MISFKITITDPFCILNFQLQNEITADILSTLLPPDPIAENFAHKGVIISGRGPVWLFCFLTHYYHITKFVATYDPRLSGAVVVESHASEHKVGDIIPVEHALIISTDKNQ